MGENALLKGRKNLPKIKYLIVHTQRFIQISPIRLRSRPSVHNRLRKKILFLLNFISLFFSFGSTMEEQIYHKPNDLS